MLIAKTSFALPVLHRCRVSWSPGWWSWRARWRSTRPPTSSWSPRRCSPTLFPTCLTCRNVFFTSFLCLRMDSNLISTFHSISQIKWDWKWFSLSCGNFFNRKKTLQKFLSLVYFFSLRSVFVDSVFFFSFCDFCHFKIVPFFWRKTILLRKIYCDDSNT